MTLCFSMQEGAGQKLVTAVKMTTTLDVRLKRVSKIYHAGVSFLNRYSNNVEWRMLYLLSSITEAFMAHYRVEFMDNFPGTSHLMGDNMVIFLLSN